MLITASVEDGRDCGVRVPRAGSAAGFCDVLHACLPR